MATAISFSIPVETPTHCVAICTDDTLLVYLERDLENRSGKEQVLINVYDLPVEERAEFLSLFNRVLINAHTREVEEQIADLERAIEVIPSQMLIGASCPVSTVVFMVCLVAGLIFFSLYTHT